MHDKTLKTPKLTISLYIAIMFLSGTGQITGALRWLHLPQDFPGWSKPLIVIALVIFLDLSVLVLVRDFVQRRRRGSRAIGHMFAIGFTILLGVGITFVGHWSESEFDRIMAIVFGSATLIGSVVVLITTDLSEDETSVRHRNVKRAMVALVKNQPIQSDAKRVLIQSIDFGYVTNGITDRMDNDEIIRQVMETIDPKGLNIDAKDLVSIEVEDIEDLDEIEDEEPQPTPATAPETETNEIAEFLQSGADNIDKTLAGLIDAFLDQKPGAPTSVADVIERSGASKSKVYRDIGKIKRKRKSETGTE